MLTNETLNYSDVVIVKRTSNNPKNYCKEAETFARLQKYFLLLRFAFENRQVMKISIFEFKAILTCENSVWRHVVTLRYSTGRNHVLKCLHENQPLSTFAQFFACVVGQLIIQSNETLSKTILFFNEISNLGKS